MNRRSFFQRTFGALAAAYLAPLLPKAIAPAQTGFVGPLMFKGIPITYSEYCPNNTNYFLSTAGPFMLRSGSITGIGSYISTNKPNRVEFSEV